MIIAAATTTSSGINPLWIFGALQYPFEAVLRFLNAFFTSVGPLRAIGAFGLSVMVLTIAIPILLVTYLTLGIIRCVFIVSDVVHPTIPIPSSTLRADQR